MILMIAPTAKIITPRGLRGKYLCGLMKAEKRNMERLLPH
jgi:hypothetical protein